MSDRQHSSIEWNGEALLGSIDINGRAIRVAVDRDTIHNHAPGFSDALTWEIRRHAAEIFDKLKPFLHAQHQQ